MKKVEIVIDGVSTDISGYAFGLWECCDSGTWVAQEDIAAMEKGSIDYDEELLETDNEVISAGRFISKLLEESVINDADD